MKERARTLRKAQTIAEKRMWNALKDRRFCNYKFRRQYIIGQYIMDFVCMKQQIIIELDGRQHQENREYDAIRTECLESQGFQVIRFWNNEVLYEFEVVLNKIYVALTRRYAAPSPCGRGRFKEKQALKII